MLYGRTHDLSNLPGLASCSMHGGLSQVSGITVGSVEGLGLSSHRGFGGCKRCMVHLSICNRFEKAWSEMSDEDALNMSHLRWYREPAAAAVGGGGGSGGGRRQQEEVPSPCISSLPTD